MKQFKFLISFILIAITSVFIVDVPTVSANGENPVSETVSFQDLSKEEQEIFLEHGFTEEDTFFNSYITIPSTSIDSSEDSIQPYFLIVVKVSGATRKLATNRAQTTVVMESFKDIMTRVDLQVVATGNSGVIRRMTGVSYPHSKVAVMTTNTIYSGAVDMFIFKAHAQITTPRGLAATPFSATVGATSLGY